LRKAAGIDIDDKIEVFYQIDGEAANSEVMKSIEQH